MANRKLQKIVSYQFTSQSEITEHEPIKKLLEEGWDVVQFQVNNQGQAGNTQLVTVLLEHTSKNPQSNW